MVGNGFTQEDNLQGRHRIRKHRGLISGLQDSNIQDQSISQDRYARAVIGVYVYGIITGLSIVGRESKCFRVADGAFKSGVYREAGSVEDGKSSVGIRSTYFHRESIAFCNGGIVDRLNDRGRVDMVDRYGHLECLTLKGFVFGIYGHPFEIEIKEKFRR